MDACTIVRDDKDFHKTYIALFDNPVQQYIRSLKASDFEVAFEKFNKIYFCLNGKIMGKDESAVIVEYDFDGLALIDGENARTFWQEHYQKEQDFTFKFKIVDGFLNQEKVSDLEKEFLVQIKYESEYFDVQDMLYVDKAHFSTLFSLEKKEPFKFDKYINKNTRKKNKKLEALDKELLLEIEQENKIKHNLECRERRKAKLRDGLTPRMPLAAKKLKISELDQPVNPFEDAKNELITYVKELMKEMSKLELDTTDINRDFLLLKHKRPKQKPSEASKPSKPSKPSEAYTEATTDKMEKIIDILVEAGVKKPAGGGRPAKKNDEYTKFVEAYQKFPKKTLEILIQNKTTPMQKP